MSAASPAGQLLAGPGLGYTGLRYTNPGVRRYSGTRVYLGRYTVQRVRQAGTGICCIKGKKGLFFRFRIFKMIARFSKCDFRVPGQILDFKNFGLKKKTFFFEIEKNLEKVRNLEKVGNFRNFKDFQWVSLVIY